MKRSAYFPMLAAAGLSLLTLMGCNKLEARDQLNKGVEAYKNARFEEAIDHFQRAAQLDPKLEMAPLYLATAYAQQVVPDATTPENLKNAHLAISAYQNVLEKAPQDLNALKGTAQVYLNIDKLPEAKEWQNKVLQVDPKDPSANYTVGYIDWNLAYKNAIAARSALGMQDNGDPIKDKAACKALQDKNTDLVNQAIDYLQKAIALRPSYDDAMSILSLTYRRKADLECGDPAAGKADMDMFNQWASKTMATRKANEEKKNQQTPGGVIMDGK